MFKRSNSNQPKEPVIKPSDTNSQTANKSLGSKPAMVLNQEPDKTGLNPDSTATKKNQKAKQNAGASWMKAVVYCLLVAITTANIVTAVILREKYILLTRLKEQYQTQLLFERVGIPVDMQKTISGLDTYFLDKGRVVGLIEFLNSQQPAFKEFNFTFQSETPKVAGQRNIPLVITAVGSKDQTNMLIDNLIALPDPLVIRKLEMGIDSVADLTNLVIQLNVYVTDDFNF